MLHDEGLTNATYTIYLHGFYDAIRIKCYTTLYFFSSFQDFVEDFTHAQIDTKYINAKYVVQYES